MTGKRRADLTHSKNEKSLILLGNQACSSCRLHIPTPRGTSWSDVLGRFSGSWIILLATPSHSAHPEQWPLVWLSSPLTAAGPRRLMTVFPAPKHPYSVESSTYTTARWFCQTFFSDGRRPPSGAGVLCFRLPPGLWQSPLSTCFFSSGMNL